MKLSISDKSVAVILLSVII